jgi:hypothetical protein
MFIKDYLNKLDKLIIDSTGLERDKLALEEAFLNNLIGRRFNAHYQTGMPEDGTFADFNFTVTSWEKQYGSVGIYYKHGAHSSNMNFNFFLEVCKELNP